MFPKSKEELRRLLELRRSSAAGAVKSAKKYKRSVRNKARTKAELEQ